MKRQLTPLPRPRTSATDTSTFRTPFFGLIRFALVQPRSRDRPLSFARRRVSRPCLREIRVTGASRSGHAPRAAGLPAAARCTGPVSQSVGPPVWFDTQVPESLSFAACSASAPEAALCSTAGHTMWVLQRPSIVTPHTSGERPQASPLMMPATPGTLVHAPINSLAVPVSAATFEIRARVIVGLAAKPSLVCAAVMYQAGAWFGRVTPSQYSPMSWPGSPTVMCTSTCPGAFGSDGANALASDHFRSTADLAGWAHLYLTPAPE